MLSTRQAATNNKLTYGKARYWINQGIITPDPVKQGQKRQLSERDLWLLEIAAVLRNNGIGIQQIKSIVDGLNSGNSDQQSKQFIVNNGIQKQPGGPLKGRQVALVLNRGQYKVITGDSIWPLLQESMNYLNADSKKGFEEFIDSLFE